MTRDLETPPATPQASSPNPSQAASLANSPAGEPQGAKSARVAYFTMEVALEEAVPTYSGGLGVLAGDYLRSVADLGLPLVAVTLLYRGGYFRQRLDASGHQSEVPEHWDPTELLERLDVSVEVEIGGRLVRVATWRRLVVGVTGETVPVYFLDTDVAGNDSTDRALTDQLYGGDARHRLAQEALLGIGGVDLLAALGGGEPTTFHMNEGHSALLTLRLMELLSTGAPETASYLKAVRERCVFTTHTPVPAGHDRFPRELVEEVLGERRSALLDDLGLLGRGELDMTELGVACSSFVNAVSRRHRTVAQAMLPGASVTSVTNGVHTVRWASAPIARLLDEYAEGWRRESSLLRYAGSVPLEALAEAHESAKRQLLSAVRDRAGVVLDPAACTIGLARRVTPYKQTTLLFSDLDRLRAVSKRAGPIQVVCAGKAHPRDEPGKAMIERLAQVAEALAGEVDVVFLENYGLELAALLCSGCDVWLNNPSKPNEASGTSGMKAAVNGVPSLSVLDGWWIEGWIEGVTGWAIGGLDDEEVVAAELYDKLESAVLSTYYEAPTELLRIRRNAIALNGAFFATDRMAREYALLAYRLGDVGRT